MTNSRTDGRSNGGVGEEAAGRTRSKYYPRYGLKRAEEFARVAFDEGPWRVDQDNLAQKAKFSNAQNGAYKSLRATVAYFGMVTYENEGSLSVTQEWIDVFSSDDPDVTRRARVAAMRRPPLYQQLLDEFANRQLPPVEKLEQTLFLNTKYGSVKEAAEGAARAFLESAALAGMIDDRRFLRLPTPSNDQATPPVTESPAVDAPDLKPETPRDQQAPSAMTGAAPPSVIDGGQIFIMPPGHDPIVVKLRKG